MTSSFSSPAPDSSSSDALSKRLLALQVWAQDRREPKFQQWLVWSSMAPVVILELACIGLDQAAGKYDGRFAKDSASR